MSATHTKDNDDAYGDMDITLIKSKPKIEKILKYTKDVNKINDVINYIKMKLQIIIKFLGMSFN